MFSPSAIADFLACRHLAELERALRNGEIKRPYQFPDPGVEVLRKLGLDHELRFLRRMEEEGKRVVSVPDDVSRDEKVRRTVEAMKEGADVVYQGSVLTGEWSDALLDSRATAPAAPTAPTGATWSSFPERCFGSHACAASATVSPRPMRHLQSLKK